MKMSFTHFVFALIWLLISCFSCAAIIQCIREEKEALLQFKQGIQTDNCGFLTSWVGETDCCKWHGIRCDNHTNHVIRLRLRGREPKADEEMDHPCMTGTVSHSLIKLTHLKYLDLSYNDFQGQPIPSFIGSSLHSLKYLSLSSSNFGGEIPHQLSNLSSLTSLDLSGNGFPVKSLRWLPHLTLLRHFDLSSANMSEAMDWMHDVLNLPSLRSLSLNYCGISVSIPSSLVHTNYSSTLQVLSLAGNNINNSGIIQWLFNHSALGSNLVHLDLSGNLMSGYIPSVIGSMHSLSHLDLSINNLEWSESSPEMLGRLCSLKELDLSANKIHGDLSVILQTVSQSCVYKPLVYLAMSDNSLWGSIPDEIATFSSLSTLKLSWNQLNGSISPFLGQLSKLEWLDLGSNALEGMLSNQHLSNLSRLRYLSLSGSSKLVVDIDANWIPPFQLNHIDLLSCKSGPYFPKWLLTQKNLSYLDISNAGISDSVPPPFWNSLLSNLQYLNISNNNIHGELPDLAVALDQNLEMDLSSNKFRGKIPSFLINAGALKLNGNQFSEATSFLCPKSEAALWYLDLSDNVLTGELPDCWGYFGNLLFLLLDNNYLSGNFPASIGMLTGLSVLHMHNNNISGELPLALQNCQVLEFLDLSYNSLTGHIPHWIGNQLSRLLVLSLRSNNFHGDIPLSLCELSSLQLVDLSSNDLFGFIPNCISSLTSMIEPAQTSTSTMMSVPKKFVFYEHVWIMWKRKEWNFGENLVAVSAIDISNNKLEGPIPEQVSSLVGLVFLNFSRNRLNGSIPSKIGQLTSLQFLDFSNNQLCGEIPTSLSDVSFLEILDLSNNNLSGRIPTSTQLQSFDPSAYMGNPNLCGDPLPKCPGDQPPANIPKEDNITHEEESDRDDYFFLGLIISVILGFIVGFWGVCGTLVIKRSWRIAYFRFVEDIKDRIHVMVVVNIARAWRKN